jgi:hypothetical protein
LYHAFGSWCDHDPGKSGSGRRHVVHPGASDRFAGAWHRLLASYISLWGIPASFHTPPTASGPQTTTTIVPTYTNVPYHDYLSRLNHNILNPSIMCHQMEAQAASNTESWRPCLTEQNLRLHGAVHVQVSVGDARISTHCILTVYQTSNDIKQQFRAVAASICESDDEDVDDMQAIDRQRAASLQALEVYGGCFVSGFLAMQEPLPWLSTPTLTSASDSSIGSPRPDSATLSREDVRDLCEGQKSKWKSVKKMCKMTRKSKP